MASCVCAYCRRVVDYAEGVFDDERWYHERCYFTRIKKDVESLEKKARNKTITLEEYEELQDMMPILNSLRKSMREPKASLTQILGTPKTPVFCGRSEGMQLLREHQFALEDHQSKALLTAPKAKREMLTETPIAGLIE